MNNRFLKDIIAGVLVGALAISIIPAENIYAEPAYVAAAWAEDSGEDPGTDDFYAEEPEEEAAPASDDVPAPSVTESDGNSAEVLPEETVEYDTSGQTAAEDAESANRIGDDETGDVLGGAEGEDDTEIRLVTQFTEDCDHISGGIVPVIWNETDESKAVSEPDYFTEELVGAAELPATYTTTVRSGIRSQFLQRCWLHSMTTSSEMSMIGAGLADSLDYSERQIAYWYFNQEEGDTGIPTTGVGNWQESAGNYMMAAAAVARHIGLAYESSYPTDAGMKNSVLENNVSHIEKVIFLGAWPTDKSEWKGNKWNALNTAVKAAVKTYGAVAITYYSGTSSLNRSTYGYYTPWPSDGKKTVADHSVTVIGWDDNKVVKNGVDPGAFYVQNSWSANSGNTQNGYNWISYYDSSLGTATCYVPEHEPVGDERDEDVFFYTGTGYSGTSLSGVNRAGNVFTADVNELIDSVGFYSYTASSYTITVVTNLRDYSNPVSGNVAATVSGETEGAGFFKVPLSKGVSVDAGDKVAVLIEMHDVGGNTYRALFEGPSADLRETSCEVGQSYILVGGTYLDCGKDTVRIKTSAGTTAYSLKEKFGNVCVYAYGNPRGPFPDVPYDHPYASAITWAVNSGITKGYAETGLFGLEESCTRGQIMMFLWRCAGKPEPKAAAKSPFTDVPKSHAFYKAILWGSQKGITKGYGDGTFGINDYCTRGQIMTFIWRYKGSPNPKSTNNPFKDSITQAYRKAVIWAYEKGITKGFPDGTYRDTKQCTRGEAVKFLYNLKNKLGLKVLV